MYVNIYIYICICILYIYTPVILAAMMKVRRNVRLSGSKSGSLLDAALLLMHFDATLGQIVILWILEFSTLRYHISQREGPKAP